MKLLIFSLLLCLGASLKGQTSTDQTSCHLPNTTELGVRICDSGHNCECYPTITFNTSGATMTSKVPAPADPYKYFWDDATGSFPMTCKFKPTPTDSNAIECRAAKSVPVDVPAIQEDNTDPHGLLHECHYDRSADGITCSNLKHWTCADPHNYALLTSVDGTNRVCHRISQ